MENHRHQHFPWTGGAGPDNIGDAFVTSVAVFGIIIVGGVYLLARGRQGPVPLTVPMPPPPPPAEIQR